MRIDKYHLITYLVDADGQGINRSFLMLSNFQEALLKDKDPIDWLITQRLQFKHVYIISITELTEDQYYDLVDNKSTPRE